MTWSLSVSCWSVPSTQCLASRIYAAMGALHLDYRAANALGYAIGCPVSFLLNRSWTFRETEVRCGAAGARPPHGMTTS